MKHSSRYVIIMGFGLMLLLLILIIAIGLNNIAAVNERMDKIVSVHNVKALHVSNLRSIARERSLLFYNMLLLRDPFVTDENIQKASNYAGEFLKIRDELFASTTNPGEKQKLDQMMVNAIISTKIQQQVIDLLSNGKFDQASQLFREQSLPAQNVALSHYDSILNDQTQLAEAAVNEAKISYQRTYVFMLILSAIVITVGLIISVYTFKKTTRAERTLTEINQELEHRVNERTQALSESNHHLQNTIQTLQDTKAQLIQSEKMASLGSLVAGISHEINTPLGIGVTSATSLMEEVGNIQKLFAENSMKRSDLESFFAHAQLAGDILLKNLDRAANLIRSFKQVAVDQSSDDWRLINFKVYFDEILISLHPQYKQTRITVENCADASLQSFSHPGAIYQIISNLLLNALIHGYDEGQSGLLRIGARLDDQHIEISCADNGKGIAAQDLDRIFDPFFTTKRGNGGTGLGLNIVYNLVKTQLNGEINVKSVAGSGATFTIRIPKQTLQYGKASSLPF
jgi:signal transduction histidine kinase